MRLTLVAIVVPVVLSLCAVTATPAIAQQQTSAAPATPVGVKVPPLPAAPVEYETAEGQNIRVVVLARGLIASAMCGRGRTACCIC